MKNIKKHIWLLSLCALSHTSCEKFLDRQPLGQVGQETYFNSETNANAAVAGMYRSMHSSFSYGQSILIVPEFSAGHVSHLSAFPEYESFGLHATPIDGLNANNTWSANIWRASYATINAANAIIEEVPSMADGLISTEKRALFVGEAKFVRALHYFLLGRAFANIPLKLTATSDEDTDLDTPQSDVEAVYAQVVQDLEDAIEALPAETPYTGAAAKGRASHWAAKALLAKVYLYQANYEEAERLAEEVIGSSKYRVVDDYGSIWRTKNSDEAIFELQFDEQASNSLAVTTNGGSMLFYAKGTVAYDLYENGDQRRDFNIEIGVDSEGRPRHFIRKYPNASPPVQNLPLLRLAEIYLIHAEAKARNDNSISADSYNSLKMVQDRAGNTMPMNTFASLPDYITAIQEEKQREMMFEGETWFDFVRTGLALEKYASTLPDERYFLYPLPAGQVALSNNLTQNDGY